MSVFFLGLQMRDGRGCKRRLNLSARSRQIRGQDTNGYRTTPVVRQVQQLLTLSGEAACWGIQRWESAPITCKWRARKQTGCRLIHLSSAPYGCPGGPGLVLDAALGSADFFSRWGSWLSIVTVITGRQACIVYICSLCVQVTLINMRA